MVTVPVDLVIVVLLLSHIGINNSHVGEYQVTGASREHELATRSWNCGRNRRVPVQKHIRDKVNTQPLQWELDHKREYHEESGLKTRREGPYPCRLHENFSGEASAHTTENVDPPDMKHGGLGTVV